MSALEIILLVAAGAACLAAVIYLCVKLYAKVKPLIQNKDWKKILVVIQKAVIAAEDSGKSGADKKTQAMEAVNAACVELGIDATEYLEDISYFIDQLIDTHNKLDEVKPKELVE